MIYLPFMHVKYEYNSKYYKNVVNIFQGFRGRFIYWTETLKCYATKCLNIIFVR
jgi:hypothetical protein